MSKVDVIIVFKNKYTQNNVCITHYLLIYYKLLI